MSIRKKTLSVTLALSLLAASLLPSGGVPIAQASENVGNVLSNGGFETGNRSGWGAYSGSNVIVAVQSADKHSGNYALSAEFTGNTSLQQYQDAAAVPGKTYYYEAWVKIAGISPAGQSNGFYPMIQISAYNGTAFKGNMAIPPQFKADQDWTKVSGSFVFPSDAATLKFNFGRYGTSGTIGGKMLVDDLFVARKPDSLQLSANAPGYASGSPLDLASALSLVGDYGGSAIAVPPSEAIVWEVAGGNAVIENRALIFKGGPVGGDVSVKASYAGASATATVHFNADTQAPSWNGNAKLTARMSRDAADLSWSAATDDTGVVRYHIYLDQAEIASVTGTVYQIADLASDTNYRFEIEAEDGAGNRSVKLAADAATRSAAEPFWTDGELTASDIQYASVKLHWNGAIDDVGVVGYKIFRDGTEIATVPATEEYTVSGLLQHTKYTFRVEAVDADGHWSVGGPELAVETTYRTSAPAAVDVKESEVLRPADKEILGYNNDWNESQRVIMQPMPSLAFNDQYLPLMQDVELPLSRMAGTDSQAFMWKKTLGPYAGRTGFPNQWYPVVPMNMGIVEWLKSVLAVTPDSEITWTLNMRQADYASDAADLAEFLTSPGDGSVNPNGGTDWGALRRQYGIQDPVRVIFELGNELDQSKSFPAPVYIQMSKEIIAAIRAVDPDAKFAAGAKTGPWSSDIAGGGTNDGTPTGTWRDWHKAVLAGIGNDIDYLVLHPYYFGETPAYVEQFMDSITGDIRDWENGGGRTDPSHHIRLYLSEHGIWPLRGEPFDQINKYSYRTHDLEGTLGTAEFINRIFNRPDVAMAALHAFSSGPWFAFDKGTNGLFRTGIAEMMIVMNQALGKDVVRSTVTGDYTDKTKGDASFTVNAMSTDTGGLNIVMVNREDKMRRDVGFTFEHGYRLVKKTVLTGPDMLSDNLNGSHPITVQTAAVDGAEPLASYVVPDKSIVVLYLERIDDIAPVTTSDASDSWAKGPVNVTLTASDEGSGVEATHYKLDGGAVQSGNKVAVDTEGKHALAFWSVDRAGNAESQHQVVVRIDLTAPTIVWSGSAGTYTVDQRVELACKANDALSGIAAQSCKNVDADAYNIGVGSHTVSATAIDTAGNAGTGSISFTIKVDYASLGRLTTRFSSKPAIAKLLALELALAEKADKAGLLQVKALKIAAYMLGVKAESGKAFTKTEVDLLVLLAKKL
ncbi:OmpL47-type beta-barrel domain-containing protein [Cohnella hashimotonis]|uniref:Carbohydrate binding domain-containing protein n=1 Tax=Cohnella hashimotonis TaxID=2826895 RepID=A0ABT6TI14_9BACL|nr:carbohydrate binding domain-containing protein [Cohnella hashimotonis]MDI4645970.1 carbohydrate binding domain-containing protein [Cohnella hashimotonis]